MTEIEISYAAVPPGQVGPRPRKVAINEVCRFTTKEAGELTMEFTKGSPLSNGKKSFGTNADFKVDKAGKFPFKCTLKRPNGAVVVLGDANDPNALAGGELEVGTN